MTNLIMTEKEIVGRRVMIMRSTKTGTETIIGKIVTPIMVREIGITHVAVEGKIVAESFSGGLSLPVKDEQSVSLRMVPIVRIILI